MANRINLPYFKLQTSGFNSAGHCSLKPDASQSNEQCRSRLVDLHEDNSAIQATYVVDNIPPSSGSCLKVTQRYEFAPVGANPSPCEPSNTIGCARLYPLVTYRFIPDPAAAPSPTFDQIDVAQRFEFEPDNVQPDAAGLFFDTGLTNAFLPVAPYGNPMTKETVAQAIIAGTDGAVDNFHQKPGAKPVPAPGCPQCVHIHWTWGPFPPPPILPPRACQFGIPTFRFFR